MMVFHINIYVAVGYLSKSFYRFVFRHVKRDGEIVLFTTILSLGAFILPCTIQKILKRLINTLKYKVEKINHSN